ncbi:ATP-binding protein [Streptomyces sp. NPDC053560]|uniref:ATP-binding protein n=1 Tax=Streptomyces sp. NPDC053560 TaxID=3365711 RepID=UPI0037D0FEB5
MIRQPSRHCAVELQALPARIGQMRRIVSAQLRYWRLDALIDAATLGVTELLANVHQHAVPSKQCTVELSVLLDQLTVSVRDFDPRMPQPAVAGPLDIGGRGLTLIAELSESWGARPEDSGKVVWFTLPALGPARQEPGRALAGLPSAPPEAEHTEASGGVRTAARRAHVG